MVHRNCWKCFLSSIGTPGVCIKRMCKIFVTRSFARQPGSGRSRTRTASDVNKDWTCKDKDKDQAYKDQDKD